MLKLSEIFYSLQGESTFSGLPCVFVRLAGCNLNCSYCDTDYARRSDQGTAATPGEIVSRVEEFGVGLVEITGGEPLHQSATPELCEMLLARGYTVLLESNGSLDISPLDPRVHLVLDVKTPGSGMGESFRLANLAALQSHHQVKFVLVDEADFFWSLDFIRRRLAGHPTIIFSPVVAGLAPARLAELMLEHRVPARLQLQLHKQLWPGEERGR